jgi:hypothetical protein
MRKLFMILILLTAFSAFAVPTDEDVGAGYNVAQAEPGVCINELAAFKLPVMAINSGIGSLNSVVTSIVATTDNYGCFVGRVVPPDIANMQKSTRYLSVMGHKTDGKLILRC